MSNASLSLPPASASPVRLAAAPLSDAEQTELRGLIRRVGIQTIARSLAMPRSTVHAAAAGSSLREGTRELLRARLGRHRGNPQR